MLSLAIIALIILAIIMTHSHTQTKILIQSNETDYFYVLIIFLILAMAAVIGHAASRNMLAQQRHIIKLENMLIKHNLGERVPRQSQKTEFKFTKKAEIMLEK